MHPDRHSPENASNPESRRTEQRLRSLRPRPTTLDAESVLCEARRRELAVPLAASAPQPDQAPPAPTPWLALAAAGGCGAIVGAALACLVMLNFHPLPTTAGGLRTQNVSPGASSPPSTGNDNLVPTVGGLPAPADSQGAPNRAGTAPAEKRLAISGNMADHSPRTSVPVAEWPLSESLTSTQWLELRGPQVPGERLVAGNHLLLQTRSSPSSPDNHSIFAGPSVSLIESGEPPEASSTSLSLDPDGLLHELLGTPPGSTL